MQPQSEMQLNDQVRQYWEKETCGTGKTVTQDTAAQTLEWYESIEEYRYRLEPFIHAVAQFPRHHGKRMLEIGVGAGTDHLQWARAGLECHGVDLTDAAINTAGRRLEHYGFSSQLQRADAEVLPYPEQHFDLVYSWGVIHHSERPEAIVTEVRRVLRPGGVFIGMIYGRYSPAVFKLWVKNALLRGRPWRSFADVVWNHEESIGTKAYTMAETRKLLSGFGRVELKRYNTPYDTNHFPRLISQFFPDSWGWNICFWAYR